MSSISQIVIQNVKQREGEGKYLKKLVEISARKYGIPVQISFDDGTLGIWKNFKQAALMGGGIEGTHRIILQDDVTFERNVLEKLLYILQFAPSDNIITFYNPTNKEYLSAFEQGAHILKTYNTFWLQGAIYPNALLKSLCDVMDNISNVNSCDCRVAAYCQLNKISVYSIVPSLIQHIGAFRSSMGFPGKVGQYERNSTTYDNQLDVKSVDWQREFENPKESQIKKSHIKKALIAELYEEYKKRNGKINK